MLVLFLQIFILRPHFLKKYSWKMELLNWELLHFHSS